LGQNAGAPVRVHDSATKVASAAIAATSGRDHGVPASQAMTASATMSVIELGRTRTKKPSARPASVQSRQRASRAASAQAKTAPISRMFTALSLTRGRPIRK